MTRLSMTETVGQLGLSRVRLSSDSLPCIAISSVRSHRLHRLHARGHMSEELTGTVSRTQVKDSLRVTYSLHSEQSTRSCGSGCGGWLLGWLVDCKSKYSLRVIYSSLHPEQREEESVNSCFIIFSFSIKLAAVLELALTPAR